MLRVLQLLDFTAVLTNDGVQERDLFLQIFKPLSRNLRFLQALNAYVS